MAHDPIRLRWKTALAQAAQQTLSARWRNTLDALERARADYRALHGASPIDVRALRKAAQRVHDLEQLRAVLALELGECSRSVPLRNAAQLSGACAADVRVISNRRAGS